MPPHIIDCWQPPSRHSWTPSTATTSARPPTPPPKHRRGDAHLQPYSAVRCDDLLDSTPLTTVTTTLPRPPTPPPKYRRGDVHPRPNSIAKCDEILGSTPISNTPTSTTTTSGDSSFRSSYYRPRSVYIPSSTSTLTTATTATSSSGGRPSSSIASPTVPRRASQHNPDYNYNIVSEALRRTYSKAKSHRQQTVQEKSSAKNRNSAHFVNSYSSFPRYRRDSMDIKAQYMDDKSSSHHHLPSDKASTLLYDHGNPDDAANVYDADPMAQRSAAPYIVARKFFKQYDVRSTSNMSAKNLEICQNGVPILLVNTKVPFWWGTPKVEIVRALGKTGGGRGGPVVAVCCFLFIIQFLKCKLLISECCCF